MHHPRLGPLAGSVVLGVLWGLWHLPLFVVVDNYDNVGFGFGDVAVTFVLFVAGFTVGRSLLLTWLFNHTHGSALLAILAHASANAATVALAPATRVASISVFLTVAAAGVIIALATRGRLGSRGAASI